MVQVFQIVFSYENTDETCILKPCICFAWDDKIRLISSSWRHNCYLKLILDSRDIIELRTSKIQANTRRIQVAFIWKGGI